MTDEAPALVLDVREFTCPLPILKAKKALNGLAQGELLEVLATDPGAEADFIVFCSTTGHQLEARSTSGGVYRFLIRKGSRAA